MANPKFNVVIPYQFYNLILVFVTILVLLWGMVAIKRVYRMLRIRSAVLSDRLIQIRGLGSYLTYFDGATRSHMDAVVHTRQSMPPVAMEQLNVTSVNRDIDISCDGHGNYFLGVNVVSTVHSRVVVLFDFNARNFQQLMIQTRTDFTAGSHLSDIRLFSTLTGLKPAQHEMNSVIFPQFHRNEVCSFECLSEEIGAGTRSLKIPLPSTVASFVQDKISQPSSADATSKLIVAVMVLPASASNSTSSRAVSPNASRSQQQQQHHASPSSRKSSSRVGLARDDDDDDGRNNGDLETAEGELLQTHEGDTDKDDASVQSSSDACTGTGRNPLVQGRKGHNSSSFPSHAGYANITVEPTEEVAQSVLAGIFVHTVSLPALRSSRADGPSTFSSSPSSVFSAPSDLIVVDRQFNTYTSLEVFGLAAVSSSSSSSSSSLAPSSSSGVGASPEVQGRPAERATAATTPALPVPDVAGTVAAAPKQQQQQQQETVAAAVCCGGTFIAEDCVVCLTDHKEVLLLPCRHLCVCESCLVFIDKCPVCRAAFEEYVTIKPSGSAVPATAPVLPSIAAVGVARSSSDPPLPPPPPQQQQPAGGAVAQSYETMLTI